jgi:hypothetical protein
MAFLELWRYMLLDTEYMDMVSQFSPGIANFLIILFVFFMNFIIMNMIRALISHSYLVIARDSDRPLSIEEKILQKHWFVTL